MKTRESPPPVHVHVPETTPVHVHMRRSPSKTPQSRTKDTQVKGDGGRPKVRTPWIPPGRLSCRRDVGSYKCQRSRSQHRSERDEEEQEEELDAVSKNLSVLLREQESIRNLKKSDSKAQHRETDVLLRALVEAEIDGVAVANQLTALKETIDSLAKDKRLSKLHAASVTRQQELLLEKIEMFDNTNHSLRELLREWSESERESLLWSDQRDAIKKRLTDTEAENIRLLAKLTSKEKEASKLAEHLDFEKDNAKTAEELSRILQSTGDHLESELSRAEAEKVHLAAQIQRMQRSQEQQQEELRALQEELQTLRQRREEEEKEEQRRQDQEALAALTQHAERAEESARQLAVKLQEKESQLAQALSTSSDWCLRHSKEAAAKGQLDEEISALKLQVAELDSQLHSAEERSRTEREELREQLHHLSAENASTKLDNQRLKGQLTSSEEKLGALQSDARRLKSSIKKHENLVEKYKRKVQQVRLESDEYCLQLEATQREAREVKVSLEREAEQVRRELLGRLRELETLPDRLRRTEEQLRDARQEADAHERRNEEHNSALSEVRRKVEQRGAQLETLQQKNLLLQEENNVLKEKIHNLERRLEDMTAENKDKSQALLSKDASVRSAQQQLDEKTRECSVLSRQLQQTLEDAQRQVDSSMQRVLAKERASQSKALDLQSQLSRAKSEQSQLQRSKEEMERRFQSQLQSMKDRLEQSDSTNRSLQNYVHFLKTSYGNVFGDSMIAS
ncbi:outer dense fiber protein 2-like [Plectropomus leopardus]|uniref:outer dense fiber protein 2-like n=2 Tax=Plectropomus leopardus TaxID=160734 RepID=UPI001C4BDAB9|nr:outer dense fiber protein 2-like [Plectropomus leopardus]XP_042343854.1 outer dense fiber protein 2-like [Plectropomus leopardus]XP_042343855.1 outer dense fiber protein 2-like [Plectropomus leopardus]